MNRRGFLSGLLALACAPWAGSVQAKSINNMIWRTPDARLVTWRVLPTRAAILNEHWLARIESVGAYENIRFIDTVQK